ncbi:MAG TPA: hypothetical protein VD997_04275 [Phycisphaerales bacterium]|nr:hypothetical protein [Phycisphaerales bacterium]
MAAADRRAWFAAVVMTAGALGALGAPGAALAQDAGIVVTSIRHGPGTGQAGPITRRGVERYTELLEFTPEQRDAAMALYEGYLVGRRAADGVKQRANEEAIKAFRAGNREAGDRAGLSRVNQEHDAEIKRLERAFFADLRSLCTGASQESSWARVERARRREVELRHGSVNGESVDLFELVHRLRLTPEQARGVRPLLDDYEVEVDGHLKARQRIAAETPGFNGGNVSLEDVKKRLAEAREAGGVIRDLNERHERKIRAALPEERRAEFRRAFLLSSYPPVYRASPAERHLEAALKLKDLSAAQREQLVAAKASYEREARPLNEAWVKEVQEADGLEVGDWLYPSEAGDPILLHLDKGPQPRSEAARARRNLDKAVVDRVLAVLSDEQRAAVSVGEKELADAAPKKGDGGAGEGDLE